MWLVVKMLVPELGHIAAVTCGPPYNYHVGLPYLQFSKYQDKVVAGAVARALFSVLVALTGATAVTTATCIVVLAHLTWFTSFRSSFFIARLVLLLVGLAGLVCWIAWHVGAQCWIAVVYLQMWIGGYLRAPDSISASAKLARC